MTLTRRVAPFFLVLLALSLAVGYQVVWGQPAVDPAPPTPTAVVNPHGGFGPGTQRCTACHNIHASRQSLSSALCERCHTMPTHMEQSCLDCHDPHGQTDNLALIRETVNDQPVVLHQRTGKASFSEGDDDPDALCVACHTETRFHRPGALETHFESQDCTRCHQHQYGFWPENIQCYECHSTPPPTGDHITHSQAAYGPVVHTTCETCHWQVTTWKVHRDGRVEFADHKSLAETSACDTCHGTAAGVQQAKALWGSEGRVDCATCHNGEDPAQINGATAPPVSDFWTTSGHGNTQGFASGNPGAGLACETCHNPNAPHIGASANNRLRAEPYALCLSCHGAGGSASVKVNTHGNTHFAFRFQDKFQVDCIECHDPHGTSNLLMIRSDIRGNPITFTARSGANSFDEPDDNNADDLCATCHTRTTHNRQPSNRAETPHFEGVDCTTCHKHNRDDRPGTVDGFVLGDIGCTFCHGQPPPPASSGYPLDESKTPHQIHAAESGYGFACARCHDVSNPNYAGHRTDTPSFQDVWFDSSNPEGQYNADARTCGGVYCHSNGDPAGSTPLVYRPVTWAENASLDCNGCHGGAASQTTNAHGKHLAVRYRDRGETSIGCYECHSATAADDNNNVIAKRGNHVDKAKQVAIDETDVWGDAGSATFDSASLTCATSRCHSNGAASRAFPDKPTYTSPTWTDPASGACGTCHGINEDTLTTSPHSIHLPIFSTCITCHAGYDNPTHVNGQVDFADGNTLPNTNVCSQCHGAQASGQSQSAPPERPQAEPSPGPATPTPAPKATGGLPTSTATPTSVPTPVPTPTFELVPVPIKPTLQPPIEPIVPPAPEQ